MTGVGRAFEKLDGLFKETDLWKQDSGKALNSGIRLTEEITTQVREGTTKIRFGPRIVISESLNLIKWSDALTKLYVSTMKGWTDQKSVVVKSPRKNDVLFQLMDLERETSKWNDVIGDKMVSTGRDYNENNFKDKQTSAMDKAILALRTGSKS